MEKRLLGEVRGFCALLMEISIAKTKSQAISALKVHNRNTIHLDNSIVLEMHLCFFTPSGLCD